MNRRRWVWVILLSVIIVCVAFALASRPARFAHEFRQIALAHGLYQPDDSSPYFISYDISEAERKALIADVDRFAKRHGLVRSHYFNPGAAHSNSYDPRFEWTGQRGVCIGWTSGEYTSMWITDGYAFWEY